MKVLILSHADSSGGAGIAAYRLATELNKHGVSATLGVLTKKTPSPFVIVLPKKHKNKFVCCINAIKRSFLPSIRSERFKTSNEILHSTNYESIIDVNWINKSDFDVVNLHWICGDMISIKDISRIIKPIIWTMHDSWPACGAEHYQNMLENDTRYQEGYFRNNKPKSTTGPDISRVVWKIKKKYLMSKRIFFTAPSRWEQQVLKTSYLFKDKSCVCIPNIIPHDVFFRKDKNIIRSLYGLPANKRIIAFGAAYEINNPRAVKGSGYLVQALKKLKNPDDYFFVIFGPANAEFIEQIPIPFFATRFVADPTILSTIYNACDVFICPSIIENLPNTCLEAICCGVPVVAFDVGGIPEIVEHKKNGYLAKPYDAEDLAQGIEYCFGNLAVLSEYCIEKANRDFDTDETVQKYIDVYKGASNGAL